MPGYLNVDPVHGTGAWKVAMPARIPLPDSSVDAIRASHVMEHIPAGQPRLDTMAEFHRLLRPGGQLVIIVPLAFHWQAYADPTHVSLWVPESFHYFDGTMAPQADYGMPMWETQDWHESDGWEGHWTATPVKPRRGDQCDDTCTVDCGHCKGGPR